MALAAGLRVVEWSQAIRDVFQLVECFLFGLVDGIIARAVAPVVESGGCLRRGARNRDLNRWCGRTHTARRQRERHSGEPHRGARRPDANHANLLPGPKILLPRLHFPISVSRQCSRAAPPTMPRLNLRGFATAIRGTRAAARPRARPLPVGY